MEKLFGEFRLAVKRIAKKKGYTYAKMASAAGIEECTIKSFMCGVSDSRRVAEKIADVLGILLIYSDGKYTCIMASDRKE